MLGIETVVYSLGFQFGSRTSVRRYAFPSVLSFFRNSSIPFPLFLVSHFQFLISKQSLRIAAAPILSIRSIA